MLHNANNTPLKAVTHSRKTSSKNLHRCTWPK